MILEVRDLTKSFGGVHAVDHCTLTCRENSITAIIGPNGAGKSTLFNLIAGLLAPDSGTIRFRGHHLEDALAYERPAYGLVKTFQIPREFGGLTVLENVMVAARGQPGENPLRSLLGTQRVWAAEKETEERARRLIDYVGLASLAEEPSKVLSGGQRKLLELARALMVDPEMILLDEPVAGVNPTMAAKLMDLVRNLRTQGKTFLFIEHDMDIVMAHSDTVIVMHEGRPIAEGKPSEIRADPRVVSVYLGG